VSSPAFEAFLARLYVDRSFRAQFLEDAEGAARRAGFSASECVALARIDRPGLLLAAESFEHKRAAKRGVRSPAARRRARGP
jgi:hypothetical protein